MKAQGTTQVETPNVNGVNVGQVMKVTKGKANPRMASGLIEEKLEAMRSNGE